MKRVSLFFFIGIVTVVSAFAFEVDGIRYAVTSHTKPHTAEVIPQRNGYTGAIIIPDSVIYYGRIFHITSIGNAAFADCNITSVRIPPSVKNIGISAFERCGSLSEIELPRSLENIGRKAFMLCSRLKTVTIPGKVANIGERAFAGCSRLEWVRIPASVINIENQVFANCHRLISIEVDGNNPKYASFDGILFNKNATTLLIYPVGRRGEYAIPSSVTRIGDYAFAGCNRLTTIEIPNSIKTIGESAFANCSNITSVVIPASVIRIGSRTFASCDKLASVQILNPTIHIGNNAFSDTQWYDEHPDGLLYINKMLYEYKGEMPPNTSIRIAEGTTTIAPSAFEGCAGLVAIWIPPSVSSIPRYAF